MGSIIVGSGIEMVPFQEHFITEAYLSWLNDKETMRYSRQRFLQHTRESCLSYLSTFEGSPHKFWSVHRRPDGLQIGTVTAYVDDRSAVADIGLLVGHPEARGKGFGREVWGLAMDYLFRVEDLRKVTGGTSAANVAMVKIFLHWRMALEGVRREQELIDGYPTDVLLFGMLRGEWERCFPQRLAVAGQTKSPGEPSSGDTA